MPLTVLDCNKAIAETGSGIRKVADGHGLYLFVKNGKASWTWQFRTDSGWSSKGFGRFPDVTPKAARDAVGDYKAALRNGTAMVPVRMPRQPRAEFHRLRFQGRGARMGQMEVRRLEGRFPDLGAGTGAAQPIAVQDARRD